MKIYGVNIHFKEVIIIICILFFTVLMNYVDISPYIKYYAKRDRYVQVISIFVISLTFIMSFRSTYEIKIDYIFNALIVTLLFSFLTKPKNIVEKELNKVENKIHDKVNSFKQKK